MRKNKALLFILLILSTLPLVFCSCSECTHIWNEGYVAKSPTDKEPGYRVYTCNACGESKSEEIAKLSHIEHDYSKAQWGGDSTHHWLLCSYEDCAVTTGKHEHTWRDATDGGIICEVCHASSTHSFAASLQNSHSFHWNVCDDEGCTAIANKAPHTWVEGDNEQQICQECQRVADHTFESNSWGADATYHWLICDEKDCYAITAKDEHTWAEGKNICTVCNHTK